MHDPLKLLPFQKRFLKAALDPATKYSVLSCPRGNGKTTLCAWLAEQYLTPGTPFHIPGGRSHIIAASINQAPGGMVIHLGASGQGAPSI